MTAEFKKSPKIIEKRTETEDFPTLPNKKTKREKYERCHDDTLEDYVYDKSKNLRNSTQKAVKDAQNKRLLTPGKTDESWVAEENDDWLTPKGEGKKVGKKQVKLLKKAEESEDDELSESENFGMEEKSDEDEEMEEESDDELMMKDDFDGEAGEEEEVDDEEYDYGDDIDEDDDVDVDDEEESDGQEKDGEKVLPFEKLANKTKEKAKKRK